MQKSGANSSYIGSFKEAVSTTIEGAKITLKHLKGAIFYQRKKAETVNYEGYFTDKEGIVTLHYPHETIPVPDNGRYKLHNEIDDCIVCDKCAKICPVDCIEIEAVKATDVIGVTSDGTSKRLHAAKFDIDMAKCCYCGLCTTVCPTECLTMTKSYDFSEFDIGNMIYHFTDLTPEEAQQKREEYEEAQLKKQAAALATKQGQTESSEQKTVQKGGKPAFRPKAGKVIRKKAETDKSEGEEQKSTPEAQEQKKAKPVFRPKAGKVARKKAAPDKEDQRIEPEKGQEGDAKEPKSAKPVYRPKARPIRKISRKNEGDGENDPDQ